MTVAKSAGWWWPFSNAVILTERPVSLSRDDRGRLHAESGPAILYLDGFGIWAWHGVRVRREIIESPDTLTAAEIDGEVNAEIRRVMVERFGEARYIQESGAKIIHRDEWGTLYRKEQPDDEPICMVKVVNSTAEPDGSFKDYWLGVKPDCKTALEAVASTFRIDGKPINPRQYLELMAQQT